MDLSPELRSRLNSIETYVRYITAAEATEILPQQEVVPVPVEYPSCLPARLRTPDGIFGLSSGRSTKVKEERKAAILAALAAAGGTHFDCGDILVTPGGAYANIDNVRPDNLDHNFGPATIGIFDTTRALRQSPCTCSSCQAGRALHGVPEPAPIFTFYPYRTAVVFMRERHPHVPDLNAASSLCLGAEGQRQVEYYISKGLATPAVAVIVAVLQHVNFPGAYGGWWNDSSVPCVTCGQPARRRGGMYCSICGGITHPNGKRCHLLCARLSRYICYGCFVEWLAGGSMCPPAMPTSHMRPVSCCETCRAGDFLLANSMRLRGAPLKEYGARKMYVPESWESSLG